MNNFKKHFHRELDILRDNLDKDDKLLIEPFVDIIDEICDIFAGEGHSGGSAPYSAGALSQTIKKILLFEPLSPITGDDSEWVDVSDDMGRKENDTPVFQNSRCSAIFKDGKDGTAHYNHAIVWVGDTVGESGSVGWDTFTGTVEGIRSSQNIKSFPFKPKTFRIDVSRVPYDPGKHLQSDAVSCGPGDFVYLIKDKSQLDEVFEYYDLRKQNLKA